MDSLDHYRQIIENILREHAAIPYSYGEVERHVVFDREVARELADAGVPKQQIVLGFREPEIRPYTEYAVA